MLKNVEPDTPYLIWLLQHMQQYPGRTFTEDDIANDLGWALTRVRRSVQKLHEAERILLTHTVGGETGYVVADSIDTNQD